MNHMQTLFNQLARHGHHLQFKSDVCLTLYDDEEEPLCDIESIPDNMFNVFYTHGGGVMENKTCSEIVKLFESHDDEPTYTMSNQKFNKFNTHKDSILTGTVKRTKIIDLSMLEDD